MIPVDHDLLALDLHTLFKMAVGEYPLEMIPVDHDLLALDLHTLYKDVNVDSTIPTSTAISRVIFLALSSVFGVPPVLKGKGVAAQRVAQALSQLMKEQKSHMAPVEHPSVDMMVLIDRQVDMVTPACTQLTYEGLFDELLHIASTAGKEGLAVMGLAPTLRLFCSLCPSQPCTLSFPTSPPPSFCTQQAQQGRRILHVANGAVKVDPAQMEQWRWTRQSWGISSLQCFPLPSNVPLSFPSLMFASPSPLLPLSHVCLSFPSPSPTQLLHVANRAVEVDPAVMGLLRAKAVEVKSEFANFRQRLQRDASPLHSAAPGDQSAASAAGVGGGEQVRS
ncbi:unnamed protein product [Closterium sp. NIES-65]|nr:unnamed protein product [Closterium sp. NIES-65]